MKEAKSFTLCYTIVVKTFSIDLKPRLFLALKSLFQLIIHIWWAERKRFIPPAIHFALTEIKSKKGYSIRFCFVDNGFLFMIGCQYLLVLIC